jgi:hypothetical protein
MPRLWPLTLLLPLLAGGCVTTTERDCGLYDFDCQDTPQGEALIEPERNQVPHRPAATPDTQGSTEAASAPVAAPVETRLQLLEQRIERLEQRLDTLE